MQLIEVPAKTGYVWFRQGIWLFRKNPLAFLTLFFTYLLVMTLVSQIPVIGGVLPLAFIPGVAVGFMAACRNTIAGKPVFPTILVDGFHSYGPVVTRRLLVLGVLYVVAMALVLAGSALADGGMLLKVMLGSSALDQEAIANSNIPFAVITALAFYIPVAMLFWFSPILAAWHDVPPVKAMFFSVVSCWRNRGAFIVFGALWFAVAMTVSLGLSALMQALGAADFAFAVLMPATMIVTTMLYCSFYATYRGCFGVQTPETPDLPTTPAA
ncbi:putative transmembrane protein [Paraburkholderia ribeironis]|uniref:Putative transmembrane protein n=1 Tax=Paraburkholderia ribeironis TaxID=1247936 RepID=A0A1N7SHC8_9BURK|nr:BPSS1780 family membrane protein [Paraburkholderia ribeironis]SIT46698.1 putative transmembrane protein [Paraburkholderia ribeironis]